MKTVIAAFRDRNAAETAVAELRSSGIQNINERILEAGDGPALGLLEAHRVPREHAELYAEGVRRGASLVMVDAPNNQAARVCEILDQRGSLDLDTAAQRWRSGGWEGYAEPATPFDATAAMAERQHLERESLVIQEEVRVGKRQVDRGGVRIRTFVTERPVHETIQLREEHVDVKRVPVDEPIAADEAFTEEEFVVTATAEEAVVEKQAHVVERVRVEKGAETRTETIENTERRRDVEVEPLKPGPERGSR